MDADYEVKRILEEKDLYKILTVSKNATEAEIKEKYRKIAKIVHPDRCHNEKATEVFQKIAHAYQVLADPEKRRIYDQYGDEPPRPQQQNYAYREEEITPEDIFSFFFGVPPDPHRRARARQARNNGYYEYPGNANQYQQRRQNQNRQNQQDDVTLSLILSRFLPFIILSIFFLLSSGVFDLSQISLFFSNPASRKNIKGIIYFSDPPSSDYSRRQTKKYKARYYLPNWWINSQRGDLRRRILNDVDSVADELYEEELNIRCELEKNQIGHEGNKCRFRNQTLR